jgi:hypothetical protein
MFPRAIGPANWLMKPTAVGEIFTDRDGSALCPIPFDDVLGDRLTANEHTGERETFSSHGSLQSLGRNNTLERSIGETEDDVEEIVPISIQRISACPSPSSSLDRLGKLLTRPALLDSI